jgi:hypothetical protein
MEFDVDILAFLAWQLFGYFLGEFFFNLLVTLLNTKQILCVKRHTIFDDISETKEITFIIFFTAKTMAARLA